MNSFRGSRSAFQKKKIAITKVEENRSEKRREENISESGAYKVVFVKLFYKHINIHIFLQWIRAKRKLKNPSSTIWASDDFMRPNQVG